MSCRCDDLAELRADKATLDAIVSSLGTLESDVDTAMNYWKTVKECIDTSGGDQAFHLNAPENFYTAYDTCAGKLPTQMDTSITTVTTAVSNVNTLISAYQTEDEEFHRLEAEAAAEAAAQAGA